MAKLQRAINTAFINSGCDIDSIEYNPASGAQKSMIVGPRFLPIQVAGGWTTNVTTATAIPYIGANLAIYNNSGSAASVTVGQSATVTSQAIGAIDANGNVGVACAPNSWTNLSMGANQWIIASSANLIVYIMEDPTYIVQESGPYVQQNIKGTQLPINS